MAERKGVLLRLDPAVHDALARWAADELRSTNAQIEFLLRRALVDGGPDALDGGPDPPAGQGRRPQRPTRGRVRRGGEALRRRIERCGRAFPRCRGLTGGACMSAELRASHLRVN